ncbi:hypothetical protein [Corynebacterium pyruviciproducens]|uniref:Uncharacterized protein n=1 Tax=Corynebacterium pyruviciproducens TaxID=598660 RepID=A0AAF0YY64_9CORY|nr:hypothetical protein [Corynebacterium pyruviciproducens]WOT03398.1 hypothetical protein CYJ47_06500 [Corynebacterium pyruviciproducens]
MIKSWCVLDDELVVIETNPDKHHKFLVKWFNLTCGMTRRELLTEANLKEVKRAIESALD